MQRGVEMKPKNINSLLLSIVTAISYFYAFAYIDFSIGVPNLQKSVPSFVLLLISSFSLLIDTKDKKHDKSIRVFRKLSIIDIILAIIVCLVPAGVLLSPFFDCVLKDDMQYIHYGPHVNISFIIFYSFHFITGVFCCLLNGAKAFMKSLQ